jgi:hypothetical protein
MDYLSARRAISVRFDDSRWRVCTAVPAPVGRPDSGSAVAGRSPYSSTSTVDWLCPPARQGEPSPETCSSPSTVPVSTLDDRHGHPEPVAVAGVLVSSPNRRTRRTDYSRCCGPNGSNTRRRGGPMYQGAGDALPRDGGEFLSRSEK